MKKVFNVLAVLVWLIEGITAIVLGVAAESFWISVLYLAIAFIAGALYYAIYMILDNQDTIMQNMYTNTKEIERKIESITSK